MTAAATAQDRGWRAGLGLETGRYADDETQRSLSLRDSQRRVRERQPFATGGAQLIVAGRGRRESSGGNSSSSSSLNHPAEPIELDEQVNSNDNDDRGYKLMVTQNHHLTGLETPNWSESPILAATFLIAPRSSDPDSNGGVRNFWQVPSSQA
ncbi:hypothetical protein TrVGV298_003721 [Trichoderma virens]|nr:hypothetical protein TrVGV298_003721 [Trichoderma virens]